MSTPNKPDEAEDAPMANVCNTARQATLRETINSRVRDLERADEGIQRTVADLLLLSELLPFQMTDAQEASIRRLIEPALRRY